jgi:hypothetical protein
VRVRDVDRENGQLVGEYELVRRNGETSGATHRRSFHGRVDPDGSLRWYFDPGWTHHGTVSGRSVQGSWVRLHDHAGTPVGEESGTFSASRE